MTLVERDVDLDALCDIFADCVKGRAKIAIVSGTVGIGKSALLLRFNEHAVHSGALVLSAICSRTERSLGLGVLDQLFRSSEMPADLSGEVLSLLEKFELAEQSHKPRTEMIFGPLRELWRVLLEMTRRQPLVLSVDDVHHIDQESLDGLLFLVRRLRSARLLLVMGERCHLRREHSPQLSEALSLPGASKIDLAPLSGRGVKALLAEHLGPETAQRLGPAMHEISAGNPLLVHAVIEDQRALEQPRSLAVGHGYSRAVLRILERGDPMIADIARGIAMLGEQASPRLLSALLGIDPESAARGIASLAVAGVLDGDRFRHEGVKAAVLSGLVPDEYMDLNTRAVHLLREEAASAAVVARHVIAVNGPEDQWVVPVLEDAAKEALADGQLDAAAIYLRMAARICKSGTQRAALLAAVAEVEWRFAPAAATRYLPELGEAARRGQLTWSASAFTVAGLLWHGRLKEGRRVLRALGERVTAGSLPLPEDEGAVTCLLLMSRLYPELAADIQFTDDLAEALPAGDGVNAAAGAQAVLQNSHISDALLVPFAIGLVVLADDGLDNAIACADILLKDQDLIRHDTWRALTMAIRGHISVRTGATADAADQAEQALTLLSPKDWGIFVGLPLSVLIRSMTTLGQLEQVSEILRSPVPEMMFRTPVSLFYLHARGCYRLAIGRSYAALSDFEMCGKLMAKWGIDLPELIPWRVEAIRASVALGDMARAQALANDQLSLLAPHQLQPRGQFLRVLAAATPDSESRHRLLSEAVEALQTSDDRLELARAIADLGRVTHELGDSSEARSLAQRANRLFEWCGVAPEALAEACPSESLSQRRLARANFRLNDRERTCSVARAAKQATHAPDDQDFPARIAELSAAEQRVASLAAQGHSNRQISNMLFITISTVEQHLTRIYRKLNVTRRLDLPVDFQIEGEQ